MQTAPLPKNVGAYFWKLYQTCREHYTTYLTGSPTITLKQMPQNVIYSFRLLMQNPLILKVL